MKVDFYRVNSPTVIFEQFDGELVAIHLETGAYHSLFGSSADAFLLLTQEATGTEIADALARKYDASPETIHATILPFLEELMVEKLIVEVEAPVARGPLQIEVPETRLPFTPMSLQAYHDLQALFLLDPVHEVGEHGWPQAMEAPKTEN